MLPKTSQDSFKPAARPLLIGSMPGTDHQEAMELIMAHTPEIPLWPQLPGHAREGMVRQFLHGLPGVVQRGRKVLVDTGLEGFDEELLRFYEDYLAIDAEHAIPATSRFCLKPETAPGFFIFMERVRTLPSPPLGVKGQITGPLTQGVGITDQNGRVLFYDERLKDAVIKLIAMKARWQVEQMLTLQTPSPPLVFFDEPGAVSFGSSAFISITREQVVAALRECIQAVQAAGGLAGIHICANGEWSVALEAGTDIISFDAYSYFDKLLLYRDPLKRFIQEGGILAWGVVPTSNTRAIAREDAETLYALWHRQFTELVTLGLDPSRVLQQTMITPACGTGSIPDPESRKVLALTRELSDKVRSEFKV
ncbi:MAG: hypothetical protein R6X07_06800 [Desulfatiglandales bacterium]